MTQIIALTSFNHLSGKTLIAAHLAVMLAKDYKTAVFEEANKQSSLSEFIAKRCHLTISDKHALSLPTYHQLFKTNFKELSVPFDVVILDSPAAEFLPLADIVITPLRHLEGFTSLSNAQSPFASTIWEAKKQRASKGKNTFKWIVLPNDDDTAFDNLQLQKSAQLLGFEIAPRLENRAEYAQGIKTGITVIDKDIQSLKNLFDMSDLYARRNLKKITDFIWRNK